MWTVVDPFSFPCVCRVLSFTHYTQPNLWCFRHCTVVYQCSSECNMKLLLLQTIFIMETASLYQLCSATPETTTHVFFCQPELWAGFTYRFLVSFTYHESLWSRVASHTGQTLCCPWQGISFYTERTNSTVTKSTRFTSDLCQSLALWPWENYLNVLWFSFLKCRMGMMAILLSTVPGLYHTFHGCCLPWRIWYQLFISLMMVIILLPGLHFHLNILIYAQ